MAATRDDLRRWFQEGVDQGATHMIVVCDTYDYEDYPVYVSESENVRERSKEFGKVMEVYSLTMSMEYQMSEHRAFHYD